MKRIGRFLRLLGKFQLGLSCAGVAACGLCLLLVWEERLFFSSWPWRNAVVNGLFTTCQILVILVLAMNILILAGACLAWALPALLGEECAAANTECKGGERGKGSGKDTKGRVKRLVISLLFLLIAVPSLWQYRSVTRWSSGYLHTAVAEEKGYDEGKGYYVLFRPAAGETAESSAVKLYCNKTEYLLLVQGETYEFIDYFLWNPQDSSEGLLRPSRLEPVPKTE
ncbi:MAG TPA: hypothetical protein H9694_05375 [Firmicutes bacterium]|nr:hypothetical protein [Bacillota bacterium]